MESVHQSWHPPDSQPSFIHLHYYPGEPWTSLANLPARGCVRSTSRSTLDCPRASEYIRHSARAVAAAAGPADTAALLRLQLFALCISAAELQFTGLLANNSAMKDKVLR